MTLFFNMFELFVIDLFVFDFLLLFLLNKSFELLDLGLLLSLKLNSFALYVFLHRCYFAYSFILLFSGLSP